MVRETHHSQDPDILYHKLSSTELLDLAEDGHSEALEQLYYTFRDQVLKYVWIVTGNHDVAVETVKQVFQTFFERLEKGNEERPSIPRFLFRKAESFRGNQSDLDPVTAQSGWELSSDTLSGEGDWTGPASEHQITQASQRFVQCFSNMPEPLRTAAGLFLLGTFTVDDIMKITSESADAIRGRIDEALRRLRVCLQEDKPGTTRTHTDECSMASERTWLQFHTGESAPSESSNLATHLQKCEECQTVSRGIEQLKNHLNDFREVNLSPFPKGDESDLLDEARKTAVRISSTSSSTPDMDPDLKQVLWLIPWGLALVVVLSISPVVFQHWYQDVTNPSTQQTGTTYFQNVSLDTGGQPVKQVTIHFKGESELLDKLQVASESDMIRTWQTIERTDGLSYIITFSSPYPSTEVRLFRLNTPEGTSRSKTAAQVNIEEAIDPDGNTIPPSGLSVRIK